MLRALLRSTALAVAAVTLLAACSTPGAATGSPPPSAGVSPAARSGSASPGVEPSAPPSAAAEGPLDVDTAVANQQALNGQAVLVRGFLIADARGARLCSVILESYPPQCGGEAIVVRGGIPPAVFADLESTADEPDLAQVAWGTVDIAGLLAADPGGEAPVLEIGDIRVAPGG
jgi:hypothetical protein